MLSMKLLKIEHYQGEKYEYTYQVFGVACDKKKAEHIGNILENSFKDKGLIFHDEGSRKIVTFIAKGLFIDTQNEFMDIVCSDIRQEMNKSNIYNLTGGVKGCIEYLESV